MPSLGSFLEGSFIEIEIYHPQKLKFSILKSLSDLTKNFQSVSTARTDDYLFAFLSILFSVHLLSGFLRQGFDVGFPSVCCDYH